MYKDKYVCSDIDNKRWFIFRNHHWEKDVGHKLRLSISREMYLLYQDKQQILLNQMLQYDSSDNRRDIIGKNIKKLFTDQGGANVPPRSPPMTCQKLANDLPMTCHLRPRTNRIRLQPKFTR